MKTIRELKAKRAEKKFAEENPLAVWKPMLDSAAKRGKERARRERAEMEAELAATHILRVMW